MSYYGENQLAKSSIDNNEEAFVYAMQLFNSITIPMVLTVAVQLDLFGIISKAGPGASLSPMEIASHLTTAQNAAAAATTASDLNRMLRLLASHSLLTCRLRTSAASGGGRTERLYGLAPAGEFFVRSHGEGGSPLPELMLLVLHDPLMKIWYHLKDKIVDGANPLTLAIGTDSFFKYIEADPIAKGLFDKGMTNHTTIMVAKILEKYKGFEGINGILVDVGGNIGTNLNLIVSKYPSIKGINFDLPHAVKDAPSYPGVKHVGGDMFVSIPKGDAILLKWICHNWDDEHCIKLLKNCYEALPEYGKVIIIEAVIPKDPETSIAAKQVLQMDMFMLVYFGGKERTMEEFEALSKSAGFARIHIASSDSKLLWVLELYKT